MMLVICNCTKDQPLEISCLVSCYANIYIKNHLKLPCFTIPIHVWRYGITGALATALFIPFWSGRYHPYEQLWQPETVGDMPACFHICKS